MVYELRTPKHSPGGGVLAGSIPSRPCHTDCGTSLSPDRNYCVPSPPRTLELFARWLTDPLRPKSLCRIATRRAFRPISRKLSQLVFSLSYVSSVQLEWLEVSVTPKRTGFVRVASGVARGRLKWSRNVGRCRLLPQTRAIGSKGSLRTTIDGIVLFYLPFSAK